MKNKEVSGTTPEGTTAATGAAPPEKKRPIETLRIGDCSAGIWSREVPVQGGTRMVYSVCPQASYVDKDGKRQYTGFLDPHQLGTVVMLLIQAAEVIRGWETANDQRRQADEERNS